VQNRRNYYRILHVQQDAPAEIIRMSYLTLMQRLRKHPDLGGDHAEATLINEAFATLIDPVRRAAYDRELALQGAMPGYNPSSWRREPTPSGRHDARRRRNACAFCGAPCTGGDRTPLDARCGACASPLHRPVRQALTSAARRTIARLPKRLPITFYLSWPQPGLHGTTEDVSPQGMRFTSTIDLVPGERVKIDCEFCAAVAVVRYSRVAPGPPGTWEAGVEFLTIRIEPRPGVLLSTNA
jgi:hypothetical protein